MNYYEKLNTDLESNRIRSNWRKMRMSHFEKRVEHLKSMKKSEMSESVAAPGLDENINTDEQNKNIPTSPSVSVSEVEGLSSQDENSNFPESEISNEATTDVSNRGDIEDKEDSSVAKSANSDIPSSDTEKIMTSKDPLITVDTQNVPLPQESLPLNYIYKKNNERSNLQDFLRDEAMKNIRSIMNDRQIATVDARLNNILESDKITEKLIGSINTR